MRLHFLAGLAFLTAQTASASTAITDFGAMAQLQGDEQRPDAKLRYRTVFSVTKAAGSPDQVNPSLDTVARFVNLLAREGIRPKRGDIVAVVSGPATPAVSGAQAYAARFNGAANPNLALIKELQKAGVTVAVCSQALAGNKIAHDQLAPSVRIDLSAITTLAMLQLKGWALITD